MSKRMNRIFVLAAGVLTLLMLLLPGGLRENAAAALPRVSVRVLAVDNGGLDPMGIVYAGVQRAQVEVLSGEHRGERAQAVNFLNSDLEKDKLYAPGDRALAMLHRQGEALSLTLIDLDRAPTLLMIFAGYILLLVIFAGFSGVGALVALSASAAMLWKVYIPLLLAGAPPILSALLLVLLLTCLIDCSVAGFTRMAAAGIIGSLLGTLVSLGLSLAFAHALRLDGSTLPFLVPLLSQSSLQLDSRALYLAMGFIGASGALTDLGMDIAAACHEVRRHAPGISPRALTRAGVSVGRTVIGTMTTTLVMAYSGSFLTQLMYYQGQGTPIGDILSYRFIAAELLHILVGCFGLVAVAPLTAWVCGWLYTGAPRLQPPADM